MSWLCRLIGPINVAPVAGLLSLQVLFVVRARQASHGSALSKKTHTAIEKAISRRIDMAFNAVILGMFAATVVTFLAPARWGKGRNLAGQLAWAVVNILALAYYLLSPVSTSVPQELVTEKERAAWKTAYSKYVKTFIGTSIAGFMLTGIAAYFQNPCDHSMFMLGTKRST